MQSGEGRDFVFLPVARNNARAVRLDFSTVGESDVPPEAPTKSTNWKWIPRDPRVFKFVDDGTILSKVNMAHAVVLTMGEETLKRRRDMNTENIFIRTVRRALEKGMKVNLDKTALLAIS